VQGLSPRRPWLIVLLVGLFMTSGCTFSNPPVPTQEALIEAPTLVPSIVPTATAIPLPSQAVPPTSTLAPTATAIPFSTATPLPEPTSTPAPVQSIDPALAAELQGILDHLVADGNIPGAVLAVHIPGREPWLGASGYRDRETRLPMEPETRVRIASISKVFTAVVVMQLVEEGRLNLDTPVSEWFPELVPYGDQTTVRRLLNHTTGLYDYLEDRQFLNKAFQHPDHRWAPVELVSYATEHKSAFPPGMHNAWDYSSTNYVILGMIVEQVTGNSLAAEMRARIFEPLELHQTFFVPDEQVDGQQARGYRMSYDQTNVSLSFAFATANIVSTVGDVQRFGEGLFGGRLLKPETLDLMQTFENGKGQYNMPELEYGLGIMRNHLPVGNDARGHARPEAVSLVMGHTGGFAGFRSVLWYAPETGVTIALGMNQGATDSNILATQAFKAVLQAQGR
jgi:D-alanyl-D-alanine carboxypeptidase